MIDIIVYISEDTGDSVCPVAYKVIRNTNDYECWFYGILIPPFTCSEFCCIIDAKFKRVPKWMFCSAHYSISFKNCKRVLICGNVSTAPFN